MSSGLRLGHFSGSHVYKSQPIKVGAQAASSPGMERRKHLRSRPVMLACLALLIVLALDSALVAAARSGYRVGRNVQVTDDRHFQMEAALAVNPEDDRNLIAAA